MKEVKEINGIVGVIPLGKIDKEAVRFFRVSHVKHDVRWIGKENPHQFFGFIPKWINHDRKIVGIAIRDDACELKHIWNIAGFIEDNYGYDVEYQCSPAEEVVKEIERHFPERVPRQA